MTKKSGDTQKPFTEKLTEILNYSALNLAMAVGYQTGLFVLALSWTRSVTPRTLEAIADKADLNPRYIKEWLGVMVTGQIVELSMGPFLYTVSLMHCMPVGLVDGGHGLGMMWGREKAVELLKAAGFKNVQAQEIPEDPFNLHYFCRK